MRVLVVVLLVVAILSTATCSYAAIDQLQKQDGPRFVIYMLQLYYNIGKSFLSFTKDTVLGLVKLPQGIAADVFHIGKEEPKSAYYLTEEEKKQRHKERYYEDKLKKQLKAEEEAAKEPVTKIKQ